MFLQQVVRICTYNANNFFLHGEGVHKELKAVRPLARMVNQVSADVIVFQEVGSAASLDSLNSRLDRPYAHCELLAGNSTRSIHLGVLSRLPITLTSHRDKRLYNEHGQILQLARNELEANRGHTVGATTQRDVLRVDVQVEQQQLALFAVHLKSRLNFGWQVASAQDIRLAECRLVSELIGAYQQQHPSRAVVLLGDFNDRPGASGLTPLDGLGLRDPQGDVAQRMGRNPSTYWPKRNCRFDRILLNDVAFRHLVPDSAMIHANQMARQGSDHYPVSVELDLAVERNGSTTISN